MSSMWNAIQYRSIDPAGDADPSRPFCGSRIKRTSVPAISFGASGTPAFHTPKSVSSRTTSSNALRLLCGKRIDLDQPLAGTASLVIRSFP
jgi:hypothetical protein